MSHMLFAAKSGWGKSLHFQAFAERNLDAPEYDAGILLDHKDEYRGLVKAGYLKHHIVGEYEAGWSVSDWRDALQSEPYVALARVETMTVDQWRKVCGRIVQAARSIQWEPFIGIEEAHFVAPEGQTPKPITELATTGRGAGASAVFVTQRLAKIANDVVTQCDTAMLGGFDSSLSRLSEAVDYPVEAHRAGGNPVPNLPEDLAADGQKVSVRKWTDENGTPTGSEWIHSDDAGNRERIDTTGLPDRMNSEHVGQEGNKIHFPEYQ